MKHLKIYENKSIENKVLNIMNQYDDMCDVICDFINFEYDENKGYVLRYYIEEDLEVVGDKGIIAQYGKYTKDGKSIPKDERSYVIMDIDSLYKFIDNPELYKKTKKYNL